MSKPLPGGSGVGPREPVCALSPAEEYSSTLKVIFHTLVAWLERRRRRQALLELAKLDDRLLADVGLTRAQALREAAKPVLRA